MNDAGKRTLEQNGVRAILRLIPGAGVTPAEGSLKPTVGFKFNLFFQFAVVTQVPRSPDGVDSKVPLI
jgi:hypothetical protein